MRYFNSAMVSYKYLRTLSAHFRENGDLWSFVKAEIFQEASDP
jgi:hypothetical protein